MARDQEQSRGERQGGRSPRGGSTQGGAGVRASHRTAAVLPAPSTAVTCRFDPLCHQAGADIKAPRGNRAQWHANFQLDEFVDTSRDVPVMHESESGLQLRGMLIIGPGHTLADAYHMLRTELQIEPERGAYMVTCFTPHDGKRVSFSDYSPQTEVLGLLPPQHCEFLLDQVKTKVVGVGSVVGEM